MKDVLTGVGQRRYAKAGHSQTHPRGLAVGPPGTRAAQTVLNHNDPGS
jgi:hypothetical protein